MEAEYEKFVQDFANWCRKFTPEDEVEEDNGDAMFTEFHELETRALQLKPE